MVIIHSLVCDHSQALEVARVSAMRSSDVTAALEQCMRMTCEVEVADLMPSIVALLSRGMQAKYLLRMMRSTIASVPHLK